MILRDLPAAARRELAVRERRYPAMVDAGAIGRGEATADVEAWRRIIAWLETGQIPLGKGAPLGKTVPRLIWTPLRDAARKALDRRDKACRKAPHDPALAERRGDVAEIHAMLTRNAAAFEAGAAQEQAA